MYAKQCLIRSRLIACLCLCAGIVLSAANGVEAADVRFPSELKVGNNALVLNGQGVRDLWFIDVYALGLYLPRRTPHRPYIIDPQVPKAFRLAILYDGTKPDTLPSSWREELLPVLDLQQRQRLREAYARCQRNDIFVISYTSEYGTQVWLNQVQVIADPGHALMQAFLDLWLGDQSVSADLRLALLN